jgi:hypothetical protein
MHQESIKTSAAMTKHPCGLTWERWHWPFKTDAERKIIADWISVNSFDDSIPF